MLDMLTILGFLLAVYLVGFGFLNICIVLTRSKVHFGSRSHVLSLLFGWGLLYLVAGICGFFRLPFGTVLKVSMILLLIPAALFLANSLRKIKSTRNVKQNPFVLTSMSLLVIATCTGLNAIVNSCDDTGRYFLLATRLWTNGNLFEPFNNWRTTVPGGALVVQSIGLKIVGPSGPIALDLSASLVIIFAIGLTSKNLFSKAGLLIFGFFVALTNSAGILPVNTVPRFLPLSLIVASFFILFGSPIVRSERRVIFIGVSLAFAATSTIRIQNLLFIGLVLILYLGLTKFRDIRDFLIIGLITFFSLLPWFASSFRDTGSAIFPIMSGNVDRRWRGNSVPFGVQNSFIDRFFSVEGLKFAIAAMLILVVGRSSKNNRINPESLAISISSLITIALFADAASANISADISRYVAPIIGASILLVMLMNLRVQSGNSKDNIRSFALLTCIFCWGLSSGSYGLKEIGQLTVSKVSATARMITSSNRVELDLTKSRQSINALLRLTRKGSTVLTAIDRSELALDSDNTVYTVAIPGFVYPEPHNMSWSFGLSPSSDTFNLSVTQNDFRLGSIYPLLEFGSSGSADMIGIRQTVLGIQIVLDHWGSELVATTPWKTDSVDVHFTIEIDRARGLVRLSNSHMQEIIASPSGNFYDTTSEFRLTDNSLGFTTVSDEVPGSIRTGFTRKSKNVDIFFRKLFLDLQLRGVDYLLLQNTEDSVCLYNNQGWVRNATSRTLYQEQSPYFFAWFDLIYRVNQQTKHSPSGDFFQSPATVIDGNFLLVDLREVR